MYEVVEVYIDRSCLGNPGSGGLAILLVADECARELHGIKEYTTNNKMELMALGMALKVLKIQKRNKSIYRQ